MINKKRIFALLLILGGTLFSSWDMEFPADLWKMRTSNPHQNIIILWLTYKVRNDNIEALMIDWINEVSKEQEKNEILPFQEYMDLFLKNPKKEMRTSFDYLIDMLHFFGKDSENHFKLFQMNHPDAPPVFGQFRAQENLYQNLVNFREEGINNKFILLIGPNGSSKTSLIRKFIKGAEEYSQKDEGSLFSFSWVFPIDTFVRGTLGLTNTHQSQHVSSYALLDDKEISAIITSELKDHPILLIPKNARQRLINEMLASNPKLLERVRKTYFYRGDLSRKNHMIYDALLKSYKGNHQDVLKHIRVERFTISKRYSSSAVTIEPQLHVDANMNQITMDRRLASLPPSLQSLNLFSMHGEIVMSNRGILEFSDLLKRPLDTFKYLLMTMETANINISGILTELDIFFIGTSNEIHLGAFKQHPDFNSFKGRFNFIRVPYLLDYKNEEKIYTEQVAGLKEKSFFEPHALRALSLFAVMTRLRAPQSKNFEDKKLTNLVAGINPLEKSFLLSEQRVPEGFDVESAQVIKQGFKEIVTEFDNENLYEGKFGLSPREVKNIIYKLSTLHQNISFLEVLEYLSRLSQKKHEYDFLNMTPQGDYHHPARFIALIKDNMLSVFDKELRTCLGLIDDRSYEDFIKKYVINITALIKGEKIKNFITGKFELYDEFFIKEFETSINLKEEAKNFRSYLMAKLGAYSLDNPGKKIAYTEVFPEMVDKLRESFRNEQKKYIQTLAKNLVYYEAELTSVPDSPSTTPLSENEKKQISAVVDNLQSNFHYSRNGAISLLKTLIKERY